MAGGWLPAALVPAEVALAWAEDHLRERKWSAHAKALHLYYSSGAHLAGIDSPKPPED
jgi:hypothetical protein